MFYYYSTGGNSKWKPIEDQEGLTEKLKKLGAVFCTVLSVSEIVDDSTNYEELKYKGPFYIDIDVEEDISTAIASARSVVSALKTLGVPESQMKVFCTGKKGFHVLVHQRTFCAGRPMKDLPQTYAEMALSLNIEGLDMRVYSARRGRMWRIPNVKRENGAYKVEITLEELQNMDEEKYQEVCKSPRPISAWPERITKAEGMSALFIDCKNKVAKKSRSVVKAEGLSSEELDEAFPGSMPPCMERVLAWDGIKDEAHFNDVVVQAATYYANRNEVSEAELLEQFETFANNSESHRFPSASDRLRELKDKIAYMVTSRYKFSCGAMVSILEEKPCNGCPLEGKCGKTGSSLFAEPKVLGMLAADEGYFRGDTQVSTFTLVPKNLVLLEKEEEEGGVEYVSAIEVDVYYHNNRIKTVRVSDEAFTSKSKFLSEIGGIGEAVFLGGDADVQKIKHHIHKNKEVGDVGQVIEVYTSGITTVRKGSTDLVYVEPGFSRDQYRTSGTHRVRGESSVVPRLHEVSMPPSPKEDPEGYALFKKTVETLFEINEPEALAIIIGWFCICHLKTHMMTGPHGNKEFPLLILHGNAGSGKTQTASLMGYLHNLDYLATDSPPSLGSITQWALIETCSTTTTVPRILDEYNRSKIGEKDYARIGEILKAAWGSQTISRGTIKAIPGSTTGRTGARTINIPISSPLVVLSEQSPQMPALLQRSCVVHLKKRGRLGREAAFEFCVNNRHQLRMLGRALTLNALRTPLHKAYELRKRYASRMPKKLDPRPKTSFQLVLAGLDFLDETLLELDVDLSKKINALKDALFSELDDKAEIIERAKSVTEIDRMMSDLSVMCALSHSGQDNYMVRGLMYLKMGKALYINPMLCHSQYLKFCAIHRKPAVVETVEQMIEMLEQEDYCVSTDAQCDFDPEFTSGHTVVLLDAEKMAAKGIDTKFYQEGSDFQAEVPKKFRGV